tara:strand:+ start:1777 stop:2598 length:822 start_codon:yes stop_codon:yes gene_type:complete
LIFNPSLSATVNTLSNTDSGQNAKIVSEYDDFYDDTIVDWRALGAKYKTKNIIQLCEGQKFTNVLDCGAGEGSVLKLLNEQDFCENLYAIEISQSGISQIESLELNKLKEVKKFDGYEIPYPDNFFDLAFSTHVLEHVEHPRILLREIKRVSKSQIFEVPLDYVINVDRYIDDLHSFGHINVYSPSTFKYLLKSEGFVIKKELKTRINREVLAFDLYNNKKVKKTIFTEFKLRILWPTLNLVKRILYGKKRYSEFGYDAYTCLVDSDGGLKIF